MSAAETLVPPRVTVCEVNRISRVGRAAWDAIAAEASVYSCYRWLEFVESFGDCEPTYLLAYHGDELVAGMPVYRFDADLPTYYDPQVLVPNLARVRPVRLAGTRHGYTGEFLLRPGLAEPVRATIMAELVAWLRSRPDGLTALLYLVNDAVAMVAAQLSRTDQIFLVDARARLPVDPGGLAGYRARVSDNTRNRMRKEMRRFTDAGCQATVLRLSQCHEHLGALSAQVLRRYGHSITADDESARFAAQAEAMDDICHVIAAWQGGRIVGFTQFFGWGDVLFGRVHGLDDPIARPAALYYNLTYYRAIEFAAANGYTAIDLGCDSYEAKVRRGARLEPLWGLAIDPGWDEATVCGLTDKARRRLDEFASWDPGIRAAAARVHGT